MLHEWQTHAAHAVEVDMVEGKARVRRIVIAGDLGTVVNPQQVRAQLEGGALMGLSVALGERIEIAEGGAVQRNFDRYRVLRMADAPPIEVILFDTPTSRSAARASRRCRASPPRSPMRSSMHAASACAASRSPDTERPCSAKSQTS